jgi:glycerate 2-kinase
MHLNNDVSETPKPGDPRFANVANSLVATPQKSLEAAARVARDAVLPSVILGNAIQGEAG